LLPGEAFLRIQRGYEGVSEGSRKFRRQLFDKIVDALQASTLTEFWRATPGSPGKAP